MKRFFIILILVAAGAAAFITFREAQNASLDRWALFGFLDRAVSSSPRMRNSRLSALLEKNGGSCEARSGTVAVRAEDEWQPLSDASVPFWQPFRLTALLVLGTDQPNYSDVIFCHDGMGNEFRIKRRGAKPIMMQLDRAAGAPIRVNILSAGGVRLSGKNLNLLLHSPLGDLALRSLANTEISVDIFSGQDNSLIAENISVVSGQVQAERTSKAPLGSDAGVVKLSAEENGRLQWEDQHEPVVSGRSATILPSGFYWNKANNPPAQ